MNPDQNLLELLRKVKAFSDFDEATLRLLQAEMQLIAVSPGETLCREGELGDRMFIIQSGQISVQKHTDEGLVVEVAVLEAGEITGEMSLLGKTERSATLRALAPATVWTLDYARFQQLMEQHGAIPRALLTSLSRHLRRETSVVARLLSRDLDRRFKVAFFDAKPYMETAFRERNRYNYAIHFFEPRLSLQTAALAAGFKTLCIFVNDSLSAPVIDELHALGVEMIALRCAGFNNVDLAACERCQISVARVPAYSPYAVAEHAAALMLALNRRIHRAHARVREGNFSLRGLVGFDMHGKTAGIVGTGKIGKCLANILAGFGCRLLAFDKFTDPAWADKTGVQYVAFAELLRQSDLISLHAPLTPETRYLINADAIARMKPGVMLINTSRGALVDTRALLEGLKTGQIGYAGLDVYEEESEFFFEDLSDRVITDDVLARLTTFNNVMVTGHQAFLTEDALKNIADTTLNNLKDYFEGNKLTNEICYQCESPCPKDKAAGEPCFKAGADRTEKEPA